MEKFRTALNKALELLAGLSMAVMVILTMGSGNAFTLAAFWAGAVANAIPGIILQLAAVPALVMAVQHVRQPVPQEG